MPQVLIVGAGPAGLVLAHLLLRAGVEFVLVERRGREELARQPKAGLVEHRTVRLLTDVGMADAVVSFETENGRCEFRTPREAVVLDYAELTGGRPHYVYPQHELVDALCTSLLEAGAPVRFSQRVDHVENGPDEAAVSLVDPDRRRSWLRAEVVVGCDGARGTVAEAMTGVRSSQRALPVRWLVCAAAAPPLFAHTVYGSHPRGFAAHLRRAPDETRYYLEVPGRDTVDDWPTERIAAELGERLAVADQLREVSFFQVGVLDLRTQVRDPMQDGRLFLVGDAAHLITPAGGKGMNLAIQDAVELAGGLIERFGDDPGGSRLAAYSATRLGPIWRTQAFSDWFLRLLLSGLSQRQDSGPDDATFERGLREGWIEGLRTDPRLAHWFAHAYAGVDP